MNSKLPVPAAFWHARDQVGRVLRKQQDFNALRESILVQAQADAIAGREVLVETIQSHPPGIGG